MRQESVHGGIDVSFVGVGPASDVVGVKLLVVVISVITEGWGTRVWGRVYGVITKPNALRNEGGDMVL